jgi:predicted alpha/beta-hydrolase family hydrolase
MVRPSFLFAPGAGAPSASAWMGAWAGRLRTLGAVETFDYPYMREGRRRPDPLPALVAAHRAALAAARERAPAGGRLFLAGKSMGSRIGCHVSLEERVDGLICFGYPLRGASGRLRDEVLLALETPVLFIQGTRDPLCPLELLAAVRPKMKARNELRVVEDGDHGLSIRKRAARERGTSQDREDTAALAAIAAFVASVTSGSS